MNTDPAGLAGHGTSEIAAPGGPRIQLHEGAREDLRALFEPAEDSPAPLDAYLDLGRVLVARTGTEILGHLQVSPTGRTPEG